MRTQSGLSMSTKQPDNWGWKARFGMFIVSNEAVPEAEWWAMAPADVSIHAARVTAQAPWAQWSDDRESVGLASELERGIKQFAQMRLSAVVIGHSSSSILGGKGWDGAVVDQLSGLLSDETIVTTNGLDCQAALRACDASKPFLVFPAWFGEQLVEPGVAYFTDNGFNPAGYMRVDPGPGWRDMPANELYPKGMGFEQDVEALYRQICTSCPIEADSILIVGTGLRCVGIIEALEQDIGKPVITANQASLWRCLQYAGIRESVSGYGNLLRMYRRT